MKEGTRRPTHERLLKAERSLLKLVKENTMFTYLDKELNEDFIPPATNNRIEGGIVKEAEWLEVYEHEVNNKANVLYEKYCSGEEFSTKKNCLDFPRLEKVCEKFNSENRLG